MKNFVKKYSQNLIKIGSAVLFVVVMLVLNMCFRYLLVDDTTSYTRLMLKELYTQSENVDVLFLGSSHCYRSIDTDITDEIFNGNTFNAGTSSQALDGSYALLKEAAKSNEISKVFLDVYYFQMGTNFKERTEMIPTYIISDYLSPSLNKYQYILNASNNDYYVNSFILGRRNWTKLFEKNYVSDLVKKKTSSEYLNYNPVQGVGEHYVEKGYVYGETSIKEGTFYSNAEFTAIPEKAFSEDDKKYLSKIIEFCEENAIELNLYSAPMPDFRLVGVGNYDSFISQVKDVTEGTGVTFYDFNLVKEAVLNLEESDFKDTDHLNGVGAEKFSNAFSKYFTEKTENAFYSSYEEKLSEQEPTVYGLIVKVDETKKNFVITPISNRMVEIRYSISKTATDSETVDIVSDSLSNVVEIPTGEHGIMHIKAQWKNAEGSRENKVDVMY